MDVQKTRVVSNGHGLYRPRNRSKLIAEIESRLGDGDGEYLINKGIYEIALEEADEDIWEEIEVCLMSMQAGEESEFCQKESKRWYRIKLISFENSTEFWKLTEDAKMIHAVHHKQHGNELFNQGNVKSAASCYSRALKYLITITSIEITVDISGKSVNIKELKKQCLLNLSICHLRLKSYKYAVETATKVLALDSNNGKALYRRGVARVELGDIDEAWLDLTKAKEYEPNSKAINDQLTIVQERKRLMM